MEQQVALEYGKFAVYDCAEKTLVCSPELSKLLEKNGDMDEDVRWRIMLTFQETRQEAMEPASEQANIYYWEYTVATHETRPCFRCMQDLRLPALLTNYPDSVIPLTVGRIPFHVRYTTEFDETGRPIRAYGSAALVDEERRDPACHNG